MRALLPALAALAACAPLGPRRPAKDTGAPQSSLASGAHTLAHGGLERTFLLHRPAGLSAGAPLVLAFHGYSSSAETLQGYAELDALADREGFVVAYPHGTVDRWGSAFWEVGYTFHTGQVDDVGFAAELVAHLVHAAGVDPARVFATGMSNGGDLSYLLACASDGLVVAVAPVAGTLMASTAQSCSPVSQPDVLAIHGTADAVTWYEGDPDDRGGYGAYLSAEDSVGRFIDHYGLDRYTDEALPDTAPGDGSAVVAHRWTGADTPARVHLLAVEGGGHDWPGAWGNEDISATAEAWAFFSTVAPR